MTSYDHDENFGLYVAILKKGEPSPLLPESDEDKGVGAAPRGRGRGGRGNASAGGFGDQPAPRAPAHSGHRADRFRRPPTAHRRSAGRPGASVHRAQVGSRRNRLLPAIGRARQWRRGPRRRGRRKHADALSSVRSPRRIFRHRSRRLRRQRRRPQAGLSHQRRRGRGTRTWSETPALRPHRRCS